MAPPNIDSNNTDIQILLITLSCCGELNLDSKVLAEAFGITRADNALRKVKQVLTKHDYKYEDRRITRIDDADGSGEMTAIETPKKTPKKPVKGTETPALKKRKLNVAGSVEDGREEGDGAGEEEFKIEIEEETV